MSQVSRRLGQFSPDGSQWNLEQILWGGSQAEHEDMISAGTAEGLKGMILQHYWGNIAVPGCSTSKPGLLHLERKLIENFKFRRIWICKLDLPLLIHIISQMTWFRNLTSEQNAGMGNLGKIWKPQAGGQAYNEGLIPNTRALSSRLGFKHKNLIPKGHILVETDLGGQVVNEHKKRETKTNAKVVLK